jgi:hypothetical protein
MPSSIDHLPPFPFLTATLTVYRTFPLIRHSHVLYFADDLADSHFAYSQHVAKLRKNRDNNSSGSAPATPSKATPKKAAGAKRAAPGSGRKKSVAPAVKHPEEDDGEALPNFKSEYKEEDDDFGMLLDTPSKRLKAEDS